VKVETAAPPNQLFINNIPTAAAPSSVDAALEDALNDDKDREPVKDGAMGDADSNVKDTEAATTVTAQSNTPAQTDGPTTNSD